MPPCFNPKHLALAGWLLLATAAQGATAPAAASGAAATGAAEAPAAGAATNDLAVSRVTIAALQDQYYTKGNWMLIEVDFSGKTNAKSGMINDVSVTLSLGWANQGAQPPVDLLLTSTLKLIGIANNKPDAVLFFVSPEVLARAVRGQPYDAARAPDYYAVEFKIGENAVPLKSTNYTQTLTPVTVKSFMTLAEASTNKGLLLSQATVPSYILTQALPKIGSNILPTPVAADAGH